MSGLARARRRASSLPTDVSIINRIWYSSATVSGSTRATNVPWRGRFDQTFSSQLVQRVPHGRAADTQLNSQGVETQTLARRIVVARDFVAQERVNSLGQPRLDDGLQGRAPS